jgi:hypothetical protein
MAQGCPAVRMINAARGLRRQIARQAKASIAFSGEVDFRFVAENASKQQTVVFPIPPRGKLL